MEELVQESNCIHKFYPPTENSLDSLLNHYFWFSKREYLNDPFDLGNFRKGKRLLSMQQIISALLISYKFPDLSFGQINSMLPEYASCSFTRDLLNKQMWAYYARDYSGWCLSFSRGSLYRKQNSDLLPAIYVNDHLIPKTPIQSSLYGITPAEQAIKQVLCTKHESWENEKEERLLLKLKSKTNGTKRLWGTFHLEAITIGNKISEPYRSILTTIAQQNQYPLYEIDLSTQDFLLTTKRIL